MSMEERILKRLLKRGNTDFMSLRYDFPMITEFGPAFENLEKLKLIESIEKNNITLISLTDNGIMANIKGLEKWAEEKVYSDIKNRCFTLTKNTSSIEIKALRNLEDEGYIYEAEKRKYKINPQNKLIIQKFNSTALENKAVINTTNSWKINKIKWKSILNTFGWWIMLLLAFLGIIEYKFNYLASAWEWFINKIY